MDQPDLYILRLIDEGTAAETDAALFRELDLAKIEAGRMEVATEELDVDDFLRQVADVARIRATQSGLSAVLASDLYELALHGDVHALNTKLEAARTADTGSPELLLELRRLVGSYDMKAGRKLLRPHAGVTQ